MTLGLAITAAAVLWLGTTSGRAALFASAVPQRDFTPAPTHRAPAVTAPVRSFPARRATTRSDTAEDDTSRER